MNLTRSGFGTRVFLLLLTNIAVGLLLCVAFTVVMSLLGGQTAATLARQHIDPYSIQTLAPLFIMSMVLGFAGAIISLLMSKSVAKWTMKVQIIQQASTEEEQWLVRTVEMLAQRAQIGKPDVGIYPSDDVNAFATGARRDHALVAVSSGILRVMSRDELQAVLGHELSHVANGDMITMSLLQGIVNTFVIFVSRLLGEIVDRTLFRGRDDRRYGRGMGYMLTSWVAQIALGFLATMIVAAYSRKRELRADAGSAQLLSPGSMIAALRRLESIHSPPQLPASMKSFGIRGDMGKLFATHPPLEERIAALQNFHLDAKPPHFT